MWRWEDARACPCCPEPVGTAARFLFPLVLLSLSTVSSVSGSNMILSSCCLFLLLGPTQGSQREAFSAIPRTPPAPEPLETSEEISSPDDPTTITGRLLDEGGAALPGWWVGWLSTTSVAKRQARLDSQKNRNGMRTDEEGRFRFQRPQAFLIVAVSPDESVIAVREDFRTESGETVLHIRSEDRRTGFLVGSLLGPEGAPVYFADITCRSKDGIDSLTVKHVGSSFRLGPLRPVEHEIRVNGEGLTLSGVSARIPEYDTLSLGELRMQRPGLVLAQLVPNHGISFDEKDEEVCSTRRDGGPLWWSVKGLLPGLFEVEVTSPAGSRAGSAFEVLDFRNPLEPIVLVLD